MENVRRTVRERSPQAVPLPAPSSDTSSAAALHATAMKGVGMSIDVQMDMDADESVEADARRTIVRALNRDPYDVWTRDSLARSVGVSSGLAGKILGQLASAGMVHRLSEFDGPGDEYTVAGDADY